MRLNLDVNKIHKDSKPSTQQVRILPTIPKQSKSS